MLRASAALLLTILVSTAVSCSAFRKHEPVGEDAVFTKAYRYFERGKNQQAAEYFNRLLEQYPRTRYRTQTQILLAEAYFRDDLYEEARLVFSQFIQLHPAHKDAELAYFRLGDCDFEQIESKDRDQSFTAQALEAYVRALRLYPRNARRDEINERIIFCRKRIAEHEYAIGRYYYKKKHYVSAADRFRFIAEYFPDVDLADDALYLLGEAYRKQDQNEQAAQAWSQLLAAYPESDYRRDAEKQLRKMGSTH